jgi:hypothetical protein
MNAFRKIRISFWIVLILLAIAGMARITSAASLNIGNAQASAGQSEVQVDVDLDAAGSEEIASLQLDLQFDDRLKLVDVTAGSQATAADKSVAWNSRSSGAARVLLYGLNQNVIGNGHVFQLVFDVKSDALSGQSDISADSLTASTPVGGNLSLGAQSGSVDVSGGAAPPPAGNGDDGGGGG